MAMLDYPRGLPPEELGFEKIIYTKEAGRATVMINRPEVYNCFNFQTDDGEIYCIEAEHGAWGIVQPVLQKVVKD